MKILSIVGARPQFIKVAAIHRAMLKKNYLQHVILHTGQHYDENLSEIFFKDLEIPQPNYHLKIKQDFASSVPEMQSEIEKIFKKHFFDLVIVYGDTNTTLAGALAAKKYNLKLAHIEAGLRSYNNLMPEEFNRIETDKISDLLFCPTVNAVKNIQKEGLNKPGRTPIFCGDVMLDAFNYYADNAIEITHMGKPFILCTLHREALLQTPEKLINVIAALNKINSIIPVLLPAHPALRRRVIELNLQTDFTVAEPVGYLKMIALLRSCKLVITDSGGLQKEAYFSKKICVTLRDETEWTELVKAKVNFLAGDSSEKKIVATFNKAVNNLATFDGEFYGKGDAAEIIVKEIVNYLI